ncbi:MAG TPA: IS1634 family transposase [Acidobacteriota bacterium]|nr:IS1634 family transposase [Acidobacteriota bacterium]
MYIECVPNRNSPPAILLREGWREGKKIRKRTLANLSHWPEAKIEALRRVLKDHPLVPPEAAFLVEESLPHGHVEAVLGTIRRLGLDQMIASKPSPERSRVLAMIVQLLVYPSSKLGITRLWHTSTLAEELKVVDCDEDDLYEAMDWLVKRQSRIEKKLARRLLQPGDSVLYDVTSSYYEGSTCGLGEFGYNRDEKRGKTSIFWGVMTDKSGRPVAVQVYSGNTGDLSTVADQVAKLRRRFALERIVMVGDRGLLTQTQIDSLKQFPGVGWISALRFGSIRQLAEDNSVQPSLFDQRNLAEIRSDRFPDERLIVCFNPLLAEERQRKRQDLLEATEAALEKIVRQVGRRTRKLLDAQEIGQKVGKVIHRFKVRKHFELSIEDHHFSYRRNTESIEREAELDGIYIIRTSEPPSRLSAEDTVRSYKNLAVVEALFRSIKGIDRLVRPIRHRDVCRVRVHFFLCLLAYYVRWHLQKAWAPLLYQDEELEENRLQRDPVRPAQPSASAQRKKRLRKTEDGLPLHSFDTLLVALQTRCQNRCRAKSLPDSPAFVQVTPPNPLQQRALELLTLL